VSGIQVHSLTDDFVLNSEQPPESATCASVLVVDDEEMFRDMVATMLTRHGFEVCTAEGGRAALELVSKRRFDVILTDLVMPDMDGLQTVTALKEADPDAEVVVVTGYGTLESAIACMKRGAFDYIQKPFTFGELHAILRRALEKRHLHAARGLHEASRALPRTLEYEDLVQTGLDLTQQMMNADMAGLILSPRQGPTSQVRCSPEPSHEEESFIQALAEEAIKGRTLFHFPRSHEEHFPLASPNQTFGSALAYPLVAREVVLGALVVLRASKRAPFSTGEIRQGSLLASHIALALENAHLYGELTRKVQELEATRDQSLQTEARARAIVEGADDVIFTLDLKGGLTSLNQVGERLTGYTRQEALEMTLDQLVATEHRPSCQRWLQRVLHGAPPAAHNLEIVAKDGRRVTLEVIPRLIRHEGAPIGIQGIGRDITQRARLDIELRHAQKLESVGRLAAGIAHEINTPIQFVGDNTHFLQGAFTALQGLLEKYRKVCRLAEGGQLSAGAFRELRGAEEEADFEYLAKEIPKALSQTMEGVNRVATIVRAMKEFAHPDLREKEAADLNKALQNTLTVARNEIKYVADVELDLGEIPPVVCNLSDMNQVFLNLLVNAAHAIGEVHKKTGKKGLIRVRTRREGDSVAIAISDTGCGIPEDIRPKIFEPFFTTKEIGRGTGQGLTIARAIVVEKHGGTLTFQSEVGKGTTFLVRLPINGDVSQPEADSA